MAYSFLGPDPVETQVQAAIARLAAGDPPSWVERRAAVSTLSAAVVDAETLRLPHQVQRIIRLTDQSGVFRNQTIRVQAQAALTRLERQLTEATCALRTS